ncbi:hypothetical protein GCM10025876_26030 [Demequina litorisediminis]|uniref:Uncharacterized protein n=2 Tax=Demequina litorisediminis TaxID=1849022 RepID=A0ABQ6IET8_9MICO|nr:hypothetical protein GCM10025876_26030 [Demequina litorisediminis]
MGTLPSGMTTLHVRARRRIVSREAARATRLASSPTRPLPGTDLILAAGASGALHVVRIERRCAVASVTVTDGGRGVLVRGTYRGAPRPPWRSAGSRVAARGEVTVAGPEAFECELPLRALGWQGQHRIVPPDTYLLEAHFATGEPRVLLAPAALRSTLPHEERETHAHVRVTCTARGQITVTVAPPLLASEAGPAGYAAVTAVKRPTPMVADAVYVQSWFGKSFSDSPARLAEALRDDCREVIVGVRDYSVEVPDNMTPVVIGTQAWWEAITSSRVVVDNSWTPKEFKRRPGQKVVQTWHGTPLKKAGVRPLAARGPHRDSTEFSVGQAQNGICSSRPTPTRRRS